MLPSPGPTAHYRFSIDSLLPPHSNSFLSSERVAAQKYPPAGEPLSFFCAVEVDPQLAVGWTDSATPPALCLTRTRPADQRFKPAEFFSSLPLEASCGLSGPVARAEAFK